jgi:hypothetical protein
MSRVYEAHRARLTGADIAGEGQAGGTETFRPLDDLISAKRAGSNNKVFDGRDGGRCDETNGFFGLYIAFDRETRLRGG